jgi:hypothetical protein
VRRLQRELKRLGARKIGIILRELALVPRLQRLCHVRSLYSSGKLRAFDRRAGIEPGEIDLTPQKIQNCRRKNHGQKLHSIDRSTRIAHNRRRFNWLRLAQFGGRPGNHHAY